MQDWDTNPKLRRFFWRWERALDTVLPEGDRSILCATSGGCDSVVLAQLMIFSGQRGGWRVVLGHVHHQLRSDADEDEAWVRRLGDAAGVAVDTLRVDPRAVAADLGWSLEHAARIARADALQQLADRAGCAVIALGHQMDDQAETLLLRLLRGTGPRGLGGMEPRLEMPPRRRGDQPHLLIRPLLGFRRAELRAFAEQAELSWREDPSNSDPSILRNRIRHVLLPQLLREYNPRLVESLAELARLQRTETEPVAHLARNLLADTLIAEASRASAVTLDAVTLAERPPALITQALWRAYQRLAGPEATLGARHMEALLHIVRKHRGRGVAETHLPGRVKATLAGGRITLAFHRPRNRHDAGPSDPDAHKKPLDDCGTAT